MGKVIARIVLTGGPKGGKTTALESIEKLIRNEGYKVYVVPETATQVMSGGIKPYGEDAIGQLEFQRIIINLQLSKEKIYEYAASIQEKDSVIIYDRGIMDNKGYTDINVSKDNAFLTLLSEINLNEEQILSHYDMILHLQSCSCNSSIDKLTEENNPVRYEDTKWAIMLDKAIMEAWKNHHNMHVIEPCENINDKIQCILEYVQQLLQKQKTKTLN